MATITKEELARRQKELTELLCRRPELTMADISVRMGISRQWLYELRERLVEKGVLAPEESTLPEFFNRRCSHPPQSTRAPHHAPVRHVWWEQDSGQWAVQSALLDRWDRREWPESLPDECVVVARLVVPTLGAESGALYWSWTASRRTRWTTADTRAAMAPETLTSALATQLTRAIAWVLTTDAVTPPEPAAG